MATDETTLTHVPKLEPLDGVRAEVYEYKERILSIFPEDRRSMMEDLVDLYIQTDAETSRFVKSNSTGLLS